MDKDTSRRVNGIKTLDELRALNARNDKLVKDFGIDVVTFADPAPELLEQFAQIRLLTGLCIERPEMSYLDEWLYQQELSRLEGNTQAITLNLDIESLKLRCTTETAEVARLESFLEQTQELTTPTEEFEKKKATLEKNLEVVKSRHETLPNIPDDINLDELIANVRRLEEDDAARGGDK
ncbi:uncharacterized protein LOC128727540 [Anopheles nili]|uniref:uncharacterized protein LOC128727540 n=1 Tax=Anopheles nili TaxID=185578 RepID=UPI00237C367E|nr:uncharacterized protein LOC128727540 [Anopheles nili]